MLYFLITIEIGLMFMTILAILEVNHSIQEVSATDESDTNKNKRKHTSISKANFSDVLNGRNNYDKYKNKDGLYEPVKGKNGIKLEKEGE